MDKEAAVRKAARDMHDADVRVEQLSVMNTPTDPEERRLAYEELEMARADASSCYYQLLKAKSEYSQP